MKITEIVLPTKQKIMLEYWLRIRKLPDLKNPTTFTEKIQKRKLEDHDSRFPLLADKVLVKDFVTKMLGSEWVIPTLFSGTQLPPRAERNWELPYVIKANHGCGWNIFVKTEADRDWNKIEAKLGSWLGKKFGWQFGEWLYSEIKPQVLVEPFISKDLQTPPDYKFFVFNGETACIQVDTDRDTEHKRVFFDAAWNKLDVLLSFPMETRLIKKPASLEKMLHAASVLGKEFSFVRIDFYEVNDRPYFGEMTFYPSAGFGKFQPRAFDKTLGEKWK